MDGRVIIIAGANLMGGGENDIGPISLRCSDQRKIIKIGKSTDYSVCRGVLGGNNAGANSSQGPRCKNVIDKRQGEYCEFHRKQDLNYKETKGMFAGKDGKVMKGVPLKVS